MEQKIGSVILDDTWYSGEDLYSDGPVEDHLLEIAKNTEEKDLNRVIAEEKSWPVLYHFSNIRQNIVEWLPITERDRVLEIGSGCGAITGALAAKAGQVDCIDLSRKRSMVNAYRNHCCNNIRILLGNFQEIEKHLTEKYDYITLIGVFEYAQEYMEGTKKPYHEMIRCIRRHLKPGGSILVAIENQMGLKYWSGSTEDHTGEYFSGLEGYRKQERVRTFSRKELSEILNSSGDLDLTFYYPFPDYKFPLTIYSDEFLPREGELREFSANYDRRRFLLFDEPSVYNTVIRAGLYPQFANSFLVVAEDRL